MNTKEKLIKAAGRLFAERGYDGTSVRDIASAAGANLGAVTYHFKSKENLFAEVVFVKTEPLRELARKIIESRKSPNEKIRDMLEGFAFHVLQKDPDLKVFFAEILAGGRRLPDVAVESIKWRNKIFADVMREGIGKGLFRDCDVEYVTWTFFGMLSSYVLFQPLVSKSGRRGAYSKAYIKRIVNTALDVFMNGIRKREEC